MAEPAPSAVADRPQPQIVRSGGPSAVAGRPQFAEGSELGDVVAYARAVMWIMGAELINGLLPNYGKGRGAVVN